MSHKNDTSKAWTEKLYDFLQSVFEDDDDELSLVAKGHESKAGEVADKDVHELSHPAPDRTPGNSKQRIWNILGFLDLTNCIVLLLPILGYISSHWIIYHVQNTRELQQHIVGTALGILMLMFLLFLVFPKIMRTMLFAIVFAYASLPLLSDNYDYSALWENYWKQVSSISVQLDSDLQAYIFHADETGKSLRKMVNRNVGHKNIRNYIIENSPYDHGMDEGVHGRTEYRRSIELFQQVYDAWIYKADPPRKDLHRSPHRTILSFSGDCDDYTTLIASLFITKGYRIRIIMTKAHVYPELAIPDETTYATCMAPLIESSPGYMAAGSPPLCFHKDNEGTIWLNLDYTASYPGGPFMDEKVYKIVYLD